VISDDWSTDINIYICLTSNWFCTVVSSILDDIYPAVSEKCRISLTLTCAITDSLDAYIIVLSAGQCPATVLGCNAAHTL
jgi:hypothetical protein